MAKLPRLCIVLFILVIAIPAMGMQQGTPKASDPALVRMAAAKKVFVSNLGEDTIDMIFNPAWNDVRVDQPYNYLYAAMQNWGQYQLVLVPGDADLIFEAKYADLATYVYNRKGEEEPIPHPQLTLTILDPATHGVLKEYTEKFEWALLPSNRVKNFAQATTELLNDVATELGRPITTFKLPAKILQGPVPPQILSARTVFISNPVSHPFHGDPAKDEQLYERVVGATKTWGQLEVVASAQAADIIWEPSTDYKGDLEMTITDPRTQIRLWGLYEDVKKNEFDLVRHNNADQATVALLNHASRLAGRVAFSVDPASTAPWTLAPALGFPTTVTISAPATAKPGSDVQVHVTLKNTTSIDLDFAYSDSDPLKCIVAVSDANGKPVADTAQGAKLKAEHDSWQGQRTKYSIHPGETQTRDCAVSQLFDMSAPGKYSIQVKEMDDHAVRSNVANVTIAQ